MWLEVLCQPSIIEFEVLQIAKAKIRGKIKNIQLVSTMENWVICHSNVGGDQIQNVASAINLDMQSMPKLLSKMKIRFL
jgi:hypothetical protein